MKNVISLTLLVFLTACSGGADGVKETVTFDEPDIKEVFCGVHIQFQVCKCAFHKEFCSAVSMTPKEANDELHKKFNEWVVTGNKMDCVRRNGYMISDTKCEICDIGYLAKEDHCESIAPELMGDEEGAPVMY